MSSATESVDRYEEINSSKLTIISAQLLITMKFVFWLAVTIEGSAFFYYLIQIWVLYKKKQEIGYTPRYGTVVMPAIVLGTLFLGSLIIKYYFKSDKYATILALLPVIFMVLAFLGMIFATIFLKGHN